MSRNSEEVVRAVVDAWNGKNVGHIFSSIQEVP
jgi:hypothetical protein